MHELTEKISSRVYPQDVNGMDSIITSWLQEKAMELHKAHANSGSCRTTQHLSMIENILALTDSPKEPCHPVLHAVSNIYGFNKCVVCGNWYDPKTSFVFDPKDTERCYYCQEKGYPKCPHSTTKSVSEIEIAGKKYILTVSTPTPRPKSKTLETVVMETINYCSGMDTDAMARHIIVAVREHDKESSK